MFLVNNCNIKKDKMKNYCVKKWGEIYNEKNILLEEKFIEKLDWVWEGKCLGEVEENRRKSLCKPTPGIGQPLDTGSLYSPHNAYVM